MKWCCVTLPGWVRVVEWTQQQSPNSRLPLCSVSPGIQICMQFTCYDIYFPLNTHKTLGGVIFSIFSWITLCNMPLEVQRVKGMSRSGEERLGLGVTTWPAGRSRGVIALKGVAKHLSADSSQWGTPRSIPCTPCAANTYHGLSCARAHVDTGEPNRTRHNA